MNVMLFGPRKGGTTLVQRLLDGGRLFTLATETKIKFFATAAEELARAEGVSERLWPSAYLTLQGYDAEAARAYVAARQAAVKDLKAFVSLDVAATRVGFGLDPEAGEGWAIKEVGGRARYTLEAFLEGFPDGRVVMIDRDPRFTARAVLTERRRRGVALSRREIIREVREPHTVRRHQRALRGDPRVHVVSYEALVADVEGEMRRLLAFLGQPFDEIHLIPTLNGQPTQVRTASKPIQGVFKAEEPLESGLSKDELWLIKYYWLRYGWGRGAVKA